MIKYFFGLFPMLNVFTLPIDFLFNKVFELPLVSHAFFVRAKQDVAERLQQMDNQVERLLKSDVHLQELSALWKMSDPRVATFLLKECVQALLTQRSDPRSYGELLDE